MILADRKGIFLGNLPSSVEHAAKTGWSGRSGSELRLAVEDMMVGITVSEVEPYVHFISCASVSREMR